jgi:hypothetical protein
MRNSTFIRWSYFDRQGVPYEIKNKGLPFTLAMTIDSVQLNSNLAENLIKNNSPSSDSNESTLGQQMTNDDRRLALETVWELVNCTKAHRMILNENS